MAADETVEKIIAFLNENEEGVRSTVIAEQFLALKGANDIMASMMVDAVLKKSPLTSKNNGLWFAKQVDSPLIMNSPFLICIPMLSIDKRSIIQVSLIKIEGEEKEQLCSFRVTGSDDLLMTRGEVIVESLEKGFPELQRQLSKGRLLFANQYEQRLLLKYLLSAGYSLPDDLLLLSHLYRMAGQPMTGKSSGVVALASEIVTIEKEPVTATEYAELCGDLVFALFGKMQEDSIATINQFSECEKQKTLKAEWAKAKFTLEDIQELEERPGVYGYQNDSGNYIYVGKGANVRTRLTTYFRNSKESPAKLLQLREESVTYTCHYTGNELEAIILESRLISKYSPKLNTQVNTHALKGEYRPVPAGMYLLSAQTEDECYTVWINGKGKQAARTVNRLNTLPFKNSDLDDFFFGDETVEPSVEALLSERWLRPRLTELDRVDSDACENGEQLLSLLQEALQSSVGDGTIFR